MAAQQRQNSPASRFLPSAIGPKALPTVATVYSRAGCHLCQDAEALLKRYGFQVETVNIDEDPELRRRYNECIPLVFIDGKERFRGRIDELLLRRMVARRPP